VTGAGARDVVRLVRGRESSPGALQHEAVAARAAVVVDARPAIDAAGDRVTTNEVDRRCIVAAESVEIEELSGADVQVKEAEIGTVETQAVEVGGIPLDEELVAARR